MYILFKISASSLFANFSLDFLVEKSAIELNHISEISKPWIMFKKTPMHHPHRLTYFHRNPAPIIFFLWALLRHTLRDTPLSILY